MEALISTFHIDWKLMVAQIINFILVFLAVYLLAAKPARKLIDERTKEIEEGLLNSKKNREILENTQKEYQEIILKARNEAVEILKIAREDSENRKKEIIENASKEVALMIENGKKALEKEKEIMIHETKKEIIDLIILTNEKILSKKIDKDYLESINKELKNL